MTTVQGFYQALGFGNGEEAARFVIPEKRTQGPLAAAALSRFYGSLLEPLRLIDVVPTGPNEYRARYTYAATGGRRCDGAALVRITRVDSLNLIASIRSLSGC